MQPKQRFYSPKDVALIFNLSVTQVYNHANKHSLNFPTPMRIGGGRKPTMRFDIAETDRCATAWRVRKEEEV